MSNIDQDWQILQATIRLGEVIQRLQDAKVSKKLQNRAIRLLKDLEALE